MHFGKLLTLGLLLWLLVLADRYLFFELWGAAAAWQAWIYYFLIIIIARVVVRRLGVINILEAFFAGLVWLFVILLLDSLLAKRFLNPEIFTHKHYWLSYVALFAAVFFLHKKRHIQIRKEIRAERHH